MTRNWQRSVLGILLLCMLTGAADSQEGAAVGATQLWEPDRPWEVIDVAIALDTSHSMQPLIDSASLRLWEIVHDLTLLEPTPTIRVALITFGNTKNKAEDGWIRVETDLTQDLDWVSESLAALTSEGGQEYVGRVLQAALEELSWTKAEEALKLLIVAGNEPADQDPEVDFRDMTDLARQLGISVQAIYCGRVEEEDAESWRELADAADSRFAVIDTWAATKVVDTPFDDELTALSESINHTYLPLGEEGKKRWKSLAAQDEIAKSLSPATAASRAQVKTSHLYFSGWDLVDAVETGTVDLYELDDGVLPENVRALSLGERESYVEELRLERQALRNQIAELSEKRRAYVAEQKEAKGLDESLAFDAVVRQTIRAKAEEKGFHHPEQEN